MVKLITKFKQDQGGLSGKTRTEVFRSVVEAKKHKRFLRGSYVSSKIISQKRKKRKPIYNYGF